MNEHKNIITIEDEIKEFSDKPVKSSALYKKVKELESNAVPDASEASVGDVLTKGEDGIGWSAPSGGGGLFVTTTGTWTNNPQGMHINLNITRDELIAAITSGQLVIVSVPANETTGSPAFIAPITGFVQKTFAEDTAIETYTFDTRMIHIATESSVYDDIFAQSGIVGEPFGPVVVQAAK